MNDTNVSLAFPNLTVLWGGGGGGRGGGGRTAVDMAVDLPCGGPSWQQHGPNLSLSCLFPLTASSGHPLAESTPSLAAAKEGLSHAVLGGH